MQSAECRVQNAPLGRSRDQTAEGHRSKRMWIAALKATQSREHRGEARKRQQAEEMRGQEAAGEQ